MQFEETLLPHLDAAYNLARWLTRNPQDAEDMVQEAYLRALRYFDGFRGGDARAWLLAIVRNVCYSSIERKRGLVHQPLDDETPAGASPANNPEMLLLENLDAAIVTGCVEALPLEFREIVVMREMEELSYKKIAAVSGLPIGTVMSRLARARKRLEDCLTSRLKGARA